MDDNYLCLSEGYIMEEKVGQLWDRWIRKAADSTYREARVSLLELTYRLQIFFRALGGDAGLSIHAAQVSEYRSRRSWLQKLAGTQTHISLSWRTDDSLYLPEYIDIFPDKSLNQDMYYWLAAIHSQSLAESDKQPWLLSSQQLTLHTLKQFPGLQARYQHLTKAIMLLRPTLSQLPDDEKRQEQAIQKALLQPGSVTQLPIATKPPYPVLLWPHPSPPQSVCYLSNTTGKQTKVKKARKKKPTKQAKDNQKHQAERVENQQSKSGLMLFRFESIFAHAEYTPANRSINEEDDDNANDTAKDLDILSVTRDEEGQAGQVQLDMDLAAFEDEEDIPLIAEELFPEWDYKKLLLQVDYCALLIQNNTDIIPCELPKKLQSTAQRLRQQFTSLIPKRIMYKRQSEGDDIDIDAYIDYVGERHSGHKMQQPDLYCHINPGTKDLSCLLLADLSLSTDAWISNHARVIDVIKESLFLFSESLHASQDRFAIAGFSSRRREKIYFHILKHFKEKYNAHTRGRIAAIQPGYYTRMGAAIRKATKMLLQESSQQRLLLLLTDGKPNDMDKYEGRYGVEDTRHALSEARKLGMQVFCITIDQYARDYLPYIFGQNSYVVIKKPQQLPESLPLLYARLTAQK